MHINADIHPFIFIFITLLAGICIEYGKSLFERPRVYILILFIAIGVGSTIMLQKGSQRVHKSEQELLDYLNRYDN